MVLAPTLLRSSLRAAPALRTSLKPSAFMNPTAGYTGIRQLTQTFNPQVKVLAVLYDVITPFLLVLA